MLRGLAVLVLILMLVFGPAGGSTVARAEGVAYAVTLSGLADPGLERTLRAAASLIQLEDEPPPTLAGLERRAATDRERLATSLRSAGHYRPQVDIALEAGATPVAVRITVVPGPLYHFRTIEVRDPGGALLPGAGIDPAGLGLVPGAVAQAPLVLEAESRLVTRLGERGLAFARVGGRKVGVDHAARALDVSFTVEPGPAVRLGEARIKGLVEVEEALVRGRLGWQPGAPYRPELVEQTRRALQELGVFESVRLHLVEAADGRGWTPVEIELAERKRHFIGFGVSFSSSEGLGGQAYWGHRNLWGGGEALRLGTEFGRLTPTSVAQPGLEHTDVRTTAELRKPDVLARDQTLVLSAAALNEHPQAYQRQALTTRARLERVLGPGLIAGYGLAGEQASVLEAGRTGVSTLAGVPLSLSYDGTDSLLDPSRGFRAALETTPWLSAGDSHGSFLVSRVTTSLYQDFGSEGRAVLAGRFSFGTITNGSVFDLPADKRFFAGGGGSVRGYGYQKVGPVNAAGDPTGGQGLLEAGTEVRVRITEELGLVPFLDAGAVSTGAFPGMDDKLRLGTGLGVRYYSDFGPLRLDVGVPLDGDRRDDPWQIYLSLGQAF